MQKELEEIGIKKENIFLDVPMDKYTTFKVGGIAECLVEIETKEELKNILKFVNVNNIPLTIIGNGSNILVLDDGVKGIVLKIDIKGIDIKEDNNKVLATVGAGVKLGMFGQLLLKNEISGFEELAGIPGSFGGAIKMNAGAHGKEMKDIVTTVKVLDYHGNEKELQTEELKFEYRKSILKNEKYIVYEIEMEFLKGKKEEIKAKMDEYLNYRKEKQPIEFPSAGSTFKRGPDYITAKLIDDAGLKGYHIGDAEVSTKHSGFIINKGNAKAKDILELINYVKEKIYKDFDKKIELEIEIIGEN